MKRLTARGKDGLPYYPECFKRCNGLGSSSKCDTCEMSSNVCLRLADYEDLELTPDQLLQIDKLYLEKCQEVNVPQKRIRELKTELEEAEHITPFAWRQQVMDKFKERR